MRISDWSSDVCSSDLAGFSGVAHTRWATHGIPSEDNAHPHASQGVCVVHNGIIENHAALRAQLQQAGFVFESQTDTEVIAHLRSEEHTSELQSLMRISYAVFCLKKKTKDTKTHLYTNAPVIYMRVN